MSKIEEEAAWAILMFDQANTNEAIERLGSRGVLLKSAIDDLRKCVNTEALKNMTKLTFKIVQSFPEFIELKGALIEQKGDR